MTPAFWSGKRVFLTGHTGFKGSWLLCLLDALGAEVHGYALDPEPADVNHFDLAAAGRLAHDVRADVRDRTALRDALREARPDVVIHMAAQALVRDSYVHPVETFEINVSGTANLLDALPAAEGAAVCLVVTSDKVYRNDGRGALFKEDDPLGGKDPYSASKACAELVTASMRTRLETGATIATARAGNVVGGGDWARDRLIPDFIRALNAGRTVDLRYPAADRPWQHVLDVLSGYLTYCETLALEADAAPLALNFGPPDHRFPTVSEIVEAMARAFDVDGPAWTPAPGEHPPEAPTLRLDCTAALTRLGWTPQLTGQTLIDWTAEWYRRWRADEDPAGVTTDQIARYRALYSNG